MKYEMIDRRARVWTITRGADGRLHDDLDPELVAGLKAAQSAEEIADALDSAVARREVAKSRSW